MSSAKLIFLLTLLAFTLQRECDCQPPPLNVDHEEPLIKYLVNESRYEKRIRPPVFDKNGKKSTVTLNVEFFLYNFLGMDYFLEAGTAFVHIAESWVDPRLGWNPTAYGDVDDIVVKKSDIWIPDTIITNPLIANDEDKAAKSKAVIKTIEVTDNATYSKDWVGKVTMTYGALLQDRCPMDMSMYPYDLQVCTFCITSFSASKNQLFFNVSSTVGMDPHNLLGGQWILRNTSGFLLPDCNPNQDCACMNVYFQRRSLYYIVNLWFPTVMICILNTCGLFYALRDSPNSIDLATMGLTTLLALSVIMLTVADQTPKGSSDVSLMGVFFILMVIQTLAATFMAMKFRHHFLHLNEKHVHKANSSATTVSTRSAGNAKSNVEHQLWSKIWNGHLEKVFMFGHLFFILAVAIILCAVGWCNS